MRGQVEQSPTIARGGELKLWAEVILNAPTKADLLAGNVFVRGQSYGSDIAQPVDHARRGKQHDVKRLETLRRKSRGLWSTAAWLEAYEAWHAAVLKRMSLPPTPENMDKVKDGLDAAWCYDRERYRLVKYTNYDFPTHDSSGSIGNCSTTLPIRRFISSRSTPSFRHG